MTTPVATTVTTPTVSTEPVKAVIEPPLERGNAFVAVILFVIVAAAVFFIVVFVIEQIKTEIEVAGVQGIQAFIAEKSAAIRGLSITQLFTCVSNFQPS